MYQKNKIQGKKNPFNLIKEKGGLWGERIN